jgi:hypothetical protein
MMALFIPVFVSLVGGFAFLRSGKFVGKDRYGWAVHAACACECCLVPLGAWLLVVAVTCCFF